MALTGVVKKYDTTKGFGFIVPTGTSTDLFVLRTDVIGGTLQAGDKVTFDEGLNERTGKPKAIRVTGGSGPAPGGKGDPDGEKGSKGGGKGKRGDKGGKGGGSKQLPGALNGGLVPGAIPGGCGCAGCPCPAPCGLMLGGGCGLGGAGKAAMPGGCMGLPDGVKSGIVKFFHDEKGFGFIKQDDGGNDLFVHRNDVIDTLLNEGDHVQYSEAVDNRSGRMKAHQVTGGTGAPKPPQENKGGKGGKGKKGGKRNAPSESSLPNPIPSLPDVPSQDSSLTQKMAANLSALSDTAAMFGCGNQGILMGKGGFPSACCGVNPCSGCGDAQNKMGCAGGCCGACGGLCGGCGCGGCGGGCGGCGCGACGSCGGCGQCMGGCGGGNCGSLPMSGNSCNAGSCGCGGCSSGNACNTGCNPGSAGSCNMPSCGACGCGGCSGCTGCGCGCGGCNTGCCGCGGCCPNFNACGCTGGPTAAGLGGCSLGNNFEEDFDASSMTMCRGGAFSGLSAGTQSPTPPCSGGCSTGPCGVGVGACGPNWEGNLQGNLQGKAAAMAPFPGQDPQLNSACFAQLMNVANLSGVASNPNPSSGDRFPAGGTPGGGSMAGSFMQAGGDNNMPGPCFSNTAGSGNQLNAAMYERLAASATGGGGGGFEDYSAVYGGQGSNNLAARAAGCFPGLTGPCSNHG